MLLNAKVNALGSLRAAQMAIDAGCRQVVYLSSIFAIEHPENGYFGSYGLSKRQGEENVTLVCRLSGVNCTILRLTQLYDLAGRGRRHQPLLYHIIDRARASEEVIFFGRRDPLRNYLFCGDLAEMLARVLERGIAGTYPCVAPVSFPLTEIARMAFRTFGTPARIKFLTDRPDIPTVHVPDGSEFYAVLDYQPKTGLAQGMRAMQEVRQA
jgi:nucleoside-diphosphate-sugar epimerase